MSKSDVLNRADIEDIVTRFYETMLKDPIVGFIFTDIAKIDLKHHLPIIVDFWTDNIFKENSYHGNPLLKHQQIHEVMPLRAGHFTRWLFLFNQAVDDKHCGNNASLMKQKAEAIAKSFSASLSDRRRKDMKLTLGH